MARIGNQGNYVNTQAREAFITGSLETGLRDNQIRVVTGHRGEKSLNPYKNASMRFKKVSHRKMIGSVINGSST